MGNNCCQKHSDSAEIYTPKKTEFFNFVTLDCCTKTVEASKDTKDFSTEGEETLNKKISYVLNVKAKAAPAAHKTKESSVNNFLDKNNKSSNCALTNYTKEYSEEASRLVQFPSKEDYLYYAMDLFDEINKYRADTGLFVDLMRKYPNVTVSKDYAKKAGFEIGWNQKLYNLLSEYLIENSDQTISLELKNKIHEALHNKMLYHFEINAKELNLEKNICEIISRYYPKHKEIFQQDYSIGALGIVKKNDFYRIDLLFA